MSEDAILAFLGSSTHPGKLHRRIIPRDTTFKVVVSINGKIRSCIVDMPEGATLADLRQAAWDKLRTYEVK